VNQRLYSRAAALFRLVLVPILDREIPDERVSVLPLGDCIYTHCTYFLFPFFLNGYLLTNSRVHTRGVRLLYPHTRTDIYTTYVNTYFYTSRSLTSIIYHMLAVLISTSFTWFFALISRLKSEFQLPSNVRLCPCLSHIYLFSTF